MKMIMFKAIAVCLMLASIAYTQDVKEKIVAGPNQLAIKIRMEGPYTADSPLQVVCYFKYTPEGVKRMSGAPVELDKHLGGVIASLRERGEFIGDDMETLLIIPPEGSIKAKALLLIGLGDEASLSLVKMERVGKTALREASRLGVKKVAFAPLIRDQGNSAFSTGDVARSVIRGVLLADDTERRLQKETLGKAFTLEEWSQEAGPTYFDETVAAAEKAVIEAQATITARPAGNYTTDKK
jgi:Cytosol aminopeptidase family, N-terminal domain